MLTCRIDAPVLTYSTAKPRSGPHVQCTTYMYRGQVILNTTTGKDPLAEGSGIGSLLTFQPETGVRRQLTCSSSHNQVRKCATRA